MSLRDLQPEFKQQTDDRISIVRLTNTNNFRDRTYLRLVGDFVAWNYYTFYETGFTNGLQYRIFLDDGINVFRLPDNRKDQDHQEIQISGNHVVWVSSDTNDDEIYLYDGINTIQLSHNDTKDRSPRILGDRVVWSGFDGNDDEIYFYDGIETIQLTDNDDRDYAPLISEDYIAWQTDSNLVVYDGLNTIEFSDNYEPENPLQLSENNLLWYGNNRISLYNGSDTIELTNNYTVDYSPQISGDNVVWVESNSIIFYDGNDKIELTTNYTEEYAPQISEDNVVWVESDGEDSEVYLYDGSTTVRLTDNDTEDREPKIAGDNIIWSSFYDDVSAQLYVYDGNKTTLLDDIRSFYPDSYTVSDRYVAWTDGDHPSINYIYLYDGTNTSSFRGYSVRPDDIQFDDRYIAAIRPSNINEIFLYDGINIIQVDEENLQVSGNNAVWLDDDGNDTEIYFYNGNSVIQLTDNQKNENIPLISEDRVVWQSHDGNDSEIYFYDGVNTIQLTDNEVDDLEVDISDGKIVWQSNDGNDTEINLYDGVDTILLTNNNTDDFAPQFFGNSIVWLGDDGNDLERYFYDGTNIIQLTNNNVDDYSYNLKNSGNNLVWIGFDGNDDEIYLYDGNRTIQLTENDTDETIYDLDLNHHYVIWEENDGNDTELYIYNGDRKIQLTDNDADDYLFNSQVFQEYIAWEDIDPNGSDTELYIYDGNNIIQLTDNNVDDNEYLITEDAANNLYWSSSDGNDEEIYFYDGSKITQITDNNTEDREPQIGGELIFWSDRNNNEIYLYDGTNTISLTDYYGDSLNNNNLDSITDEYLIWHDSLFWIGSDGDSNEVYLSDLTANLSAIETTTTAVEIPGILIDDLSLVESNDRNLDFTFTVSLIDASNETIIVDYTTADNTAIADSDYLAQNGTLEFAPGQLSQTITVEVIGDLETEADETFFVNLSNPVNAMLVDRQGTGTIINDERDVEISINDLSQLEDRADSNIISFSVSLAQPSTYPITVDYSTSDRTAIAGEDYVAQSGTLEFAPTETVKTITVEVIRDTEAEEDETFELNLSNPTNSQFRDSRGIATISNDDLTPPENTTELFRMRNTTFNTGAYIFVDAVERDAILADESLHNIFALDGLQDNGRVNPAFTASTEPGEGLIPFYRLRSLQTPGTYLFVSTEEYGAIFAEDSVQKDNWIKEGLDEDDNDIPEFYLYDREANLGIDFNRFQNTQNLTFLYAGPEETVAIENNSDLSNLFINQGGAFESVV